MRRGGSKGLWKGRRPRVRVRLKEYTAAGYLKKRMMMMAFQSRQPRGRASRRRKRREIKVRALLRRHRGLQRQRQQALQRQVWVWKPNHGLHPWRQMSSKQLLASCLVQQPGEELFMAKFNLWPSDTSSGEAPTAGSSTALGPAAVPEEVPAPAESMSRAAPAAGGAGPRYTYQYLSIATKNFEKRLGRRTGVGQSFKECWRRGRVLL
jgi:hypothetical protein